MNTINCTGKNVSDDLLYALGEADANMYLCSKDLRPSEETYMLNFQSVFKPKNNFLMLYKLFLPRIETG